MIGWNELSCIEPPHRRRFEVSIRFVTAMQRKTKQRKSTHNQQNCTNIEKYHGMPVLNNFKYKQIYFYPLSLLQLYIFILE